MKTMTRREAAFRRKHLSCVRHITLDPYGPGVVRMHQIPPREEAAATRAPDSHAGTW